jgi:hypothetical protein
MHVRVLDAVPTPAGLFSIVPQAAQKFNPGSASLPQLGHLMVEP